MYQLQLGLPLMTIPKKSSSYIEKGVITYIPINYREFQYIELALYSVERCLEYNDLPDVFRRDNADRIRAKVSYLKNWLNNQDCKLQLCSDGSNTVLWPFTSSELVKWLLKLCQHDILEEAFMGEVIYATNKSVDEYYRLHVQLDEGEEEEKDAFGDTARDHMWIDEYDWFYDYYMSLMKTCQPSLIEKLKRNIAQGYPAILSKFLLKEKKVTA